VTIVTEEAIRSLATFRGDKAPVTSCYLDVDGRRYRRHQDYEYELDALLRVGRAKADGDPSVESDLRRIDEYVKGGIDRSRTRGLAIFSCSAQSLWEVIPLPVPVRNRLVVNQLPAVGQLEAVVSDHHRFGVLLADRQRARMFVFELGELLDRSELFEELPRDYDVRGEKERGDTQSHVEALMTQHLRHAADVAWRVYQDQGFEYLAIGAPEEITKALESLLHPYLRQRLCGRIGGVPVTASTEDIRVAALEVEADAEREREAALVERLREAAATGRRGVAGLKRVLHALNQKRVDHLVASAGYEESGWRCNRCHALALVGRRCPNCASPMRPVDDVVEEAVEEALLQKSRVDICSGNADLDVLGRIGALLRY
jgi:peptide chain release factor subunit 1